MDAALAAVGFTALALVSLGALWLLIMFWFVSGSEGSHEKYRVRPSGSVSASRHADTATTDGYRFIWR